MIWNTRSLRHSFNHRKFPDSDEEECNTQDCNGELAIGQRQATPAGEQVPVAQRQLPRLDILHLRPFIEVLVCMQLTPGRGPLKGNFKILKQTVVTR
mgnify:CR=1 FL=1